MNVLVTGGAGYIGSHTCVELLKAGIGVTVIDNFINSNPEGLRRVQAISGRNLNVIQADTRDEPAMSRALRENAVDAVIHFAALKAVGESTALPLAYYDNNVSGTLSLLHAMSAAGVRTLVFSSSATVYGEPLSVPIDERHPLRATSPYGRSKLFVEEVLRDLHMSDPTWRIGILRYFNPVGAHESGLIGEDPRGTPNNLMPFVAQVAIGRRERLNVWGGDYPTPDGTGVRDYVHVVDLAVGHLRALERLNAPGCFSINLGTGKGYSVLEVIRAFEAASGRRIPYEISPRRPGDIAACYADCSASGRLLGWRAERDLQAMCADHWRWQVRNPQGYADRARVRGVVSASA
ncbi:UDP-glucose 4-epimerase GalE [Bordetella bronchialis]|uniref:UDP-glucose 4-epimerase GalE n=1 Tax=Bordetella bronchialis TaxID=463025 RepID=UPI003D053D24